MGWKKGDLGQGKWRRDGCLVIGKGLSDLAGDANAHRSFFPLPQDCYQEVSRSEYTQ